MIFVNITIRAFYYLISTRYAYRKFPKKVLTNCLKIQVIYSFGGKVILVRLNILAGGI